MPTLSHQEFLHHSPRHKGRETPQVVRFKTRGAHLMAVRTPAKSPGVDREMIWLIVVSLLGLTVSLGVGAVFALEDSWEDAHALAATAGMTITSPASPAESKVQPPFHEQFNLHPTQGDVVEPVATF